MKKKIQAMSNRAFLKSVNVTILLPSPVESSFLQQHSNVVQNQKLFENNSPFRLKSTESTDPHRHLRRWPRQLYETSSNRGSFHTIPHLLLWHCLSLSRLLFGAQYLHHRLLSWHSWAFEKLCAHIHRLLRKRQSLDEAPMGKPHGSTL